MAIRVIEELVDDLDESAAAETVTFALDGREYQIDLNKRHAQDLRKAIKPFIENARRVSGKTKASANGSKARAPRRTRKSTIDTAAVRAWAVENGFEIGAKGRIPAHIVEAYQAA